MLCGVVIVGWFLWRGINYETEPALSVQLALWTSPIQSYKALNDTINFQTKIDWQGDLAISIEDKGISLKNAILHMYSNDSLLQSDLRTLGSLEPKDTLSDSWIVHTPNQGNYSISGSFDSDKLNFWFIAFVTVAE